MSPPKIVPKFTIFLTTKTNTWNDMDDVRLACKGKAVRISGTTLDLMGGQISGSKLPQPDNEDDEDSVPLRTRIPGFTLMNGSVRGIPGGIVFREKGCTFTDLIFLQIGEDALSNIVDDSPNSAIKRCSFFGASDKSGQWNDARNLVVEDCLFVGGITGCRIQKSSTKYKGIKVKSFKRNRFVSCDTAVNCSGGVTMTAENCKYEDVRLHGKESNGASFIEK